MQRSLVDPAHYDKPIDRDGLISHIDSGRVTTDHEMKAWMRRSAEDIAEGQPLTIRAVEASAWRSAQARDAPHDQCFHEFAVLSALGDDALLGHLVRRANTLAKSIQPGATEMLGDAF